MNNLGIILELRNITKTFPGVKALDDVSLKITKGTVHAIVGENGAGKSTLMKILIGAYRDYEGDIFLRGEKKRFSSINDALFSGISMIHQELSCALELSVVENMFLGREKTYKNRLLNKSDMYYHTDKIIKDLGISNIDINSKMKNLSVAKRQLCEIAKAISYNSDIILMDEPTSSLSEYDVKNLFCIIKNLRNNNKTILYVTHKLDEVFTIADNISILKNGLHIKTLPQKSTNKKEVINMMVGRPISEYYYKEKVEIGDTLLEVKDLSRKGEFDKINFKVCRGEILGVAGLVGSGRSEIMETLFGIRKKSSGVIIINNKQVSIKSPIDAISNGFAFLTEDRGTKGCFPELSVMINIVITSINNYINRFLLNKKGMKKASNRVIESFSIKAPSLETKIKYLSGGNQQKVLFGRWYLTDPEIFIVDEPTKGIDVGAKEEVHRMLVELAKEGKAIIMISSDMPEVISMSDKIMIISEGRITGFLDPKECTEEDILHYYIKNKE